MKESKPITKPKFVKFYSLAVA